MRILEQPVSERLVLDRGRVAEHTRHETTDRLDDHGCGNLSTGEDDITNRDLAVAQMFADPLVDTFVAAAQQREAVELGEFVGHRLVEATTRGRKVEQWPRRLDGLDGAKERLRHHHHASAPAEGGIVDRVVNVGRGLTQVVHSDVEMAVAATSPDHRLIGDVIDHLRKDREDVNPHGVSPDLVRRRLRRDRTSRRAR